MNPLVETCVEISRCGLDGHNEYKPFYHNKDLQRLGRFILAHSGAEEPHLKPVDFPADEVAIGFSGGIDSYCAMIHALQLGLRPRLVFVTYGQIYAQEEFNIFAHIEGAKRLALGLFSEFTDPQARTFKQDLERLGSPQQLMPRLSFAKHHKYLIAKTECDVTKDWKNYVIPARNLVLAAICSEHAQRVWIVANKRSNEGIGTPDKTTRFYRDASKIFSEFYGRKITVESPFFHQSKLEMVQDYLSKGGSIEALKNTFSCYNPQAHMHCGHCLACFKRYKLFQALNEEISFLRPPWEGKDWQAFNEFEKAKRG